MAVSHEPVFVQTPKIGTADFVNATSTTKQTIATGGTNGSKVVAAIATSTDTGTRVVQLWLTRSATAHLLASTLVAITAGMDGVTAGANLFGTTLVPGLPVDNDGQVYLFLESGDTLQAGVTVAVTAAKTITVTAVYADF